MIKHSLIYSPDRNGSVRMRIRWHKNNVAIMLPIKIDKSKWNFDSQRCSRNSYHNGIAAAEINGVIDQYEQIAFNIFKNAGEVITAEEYRHRLRVALGKEEEKTETNNFFQLWEQFVKERSVLSNWALGTFKHVESVRRRFYKFNPNLTIETLDEREMTKFLNYLIEHGYKNTTIKKTITVLRWYAGWLRHKGYDTSAFVERFTPKMKRVSGHKVVVYLTWDELIKLYEYQFDNLTYTHVRDVFCFCCFTSLRYSDAAKLKKSDVHNGYISVVTQKTSDQLRIDLNKYSQAILDKYSEKRLPNHRALPVMSNQKCNDYLKVIGKMVGLDEPITKVHFVGNERVEETKPKYEFLTTHCGRRTFIVNALMLGIPAQVVMEWTGHSDYDAMKPYIAIVDEQKKQSMALFDKR